MMRESTESPAQPDESGAAVGQATTTEPDISARLARLRSLGPQELRVEWRRLYRSQPPRLSPDLMMRTLAYRTQELAFGGLSKSTQRRLVSLSAALVQGRPMPASPSQQLRPGTRLVREWSGRTHTVMVVEAGFEYRGKVHRSLTSIAGEITGAHWSGPRFFGLNSSQGGSQTKGRSLAIGCLELEAANV